MNMKLKLLACWRILTGKPVLANAEIKDMKVVMGRHSMLFNVKGVYIEFDDSEVKQ